MTISIDAITVSLFIVAMPVILWLLSDAWRFLCRGVVIATAFISSTIFAFFYTLFRLLFKMKRFLEEAGRETFSEKAYHTFAWVWIGLSILIGCGSVFLLCRHFIPKAEIEIRIRKIQTKATEEICCINPATGKEEIFPKGTLLEITFANGKCHRVPIEVSQPILQEVYKNNTPVLLSIMRPVKE